MDGGYLVYPLTFITAVVYALRVSVLLQTLVAELRPCRPPFLRFGLLVPVGSGIRFCCFFVLSVCCTARLFFTKASKSALLLMDGAMSMLWTKKVERLCCFFKFLILLLLWCYVTNRTVYSFSVIPAFYVFKDCSVGFL